MRALETDSYKNLISQSAIGSMRAQQDPSYIPAILERLKTHRSEFTSSGLSRAFDSLAYLARHEDKKDDIREFLLGYLNDPREQIRRSVLTALGTLQDSKALPVLEKFAGGKHPAREKTAADKSIAALETGRKPADDFQALRSEILEMQKSNRALKADLDDLKKKVEAAPASSGQKVKESKKRPAAKT